MCLPIVGLVLLADKKFDIVYEAVQNFLTLALMLDQLQKLAGHVLAGLVAFAALEGIHVVDGLVEQHFFQFFQTIVVQNGLIILDILHGEGCTVVGRRGLPLALSVLGLIRFPGGYILSPLPSPHVFA